MTLHAKQAGAWSTVQSLYIKQSGVWVPVQNAYVKNAGAWVEYYSSEVVVTIAANSTNVNLSTLFTSAVWTSSTNKRVVINAGVTIGATSTGFAAVRTGTGWGGILTLQNAGTIQGAGGAGPSAPGGWALLADSGGLVVNNSGTIRSGGGGGGNGGSGGGGQYSYGVNEGPAYNKNSPVYEWFTIKSNSHDTVYWGNALQFSDVPVSGGTYTVNGVTYTRVSKQEENSSVEYWSVSRSYTATANTSGGDGGAGGRGQGHDGGNVGGSAGSAGGTNAGTGGTGGGGGTWGVNGATGNSGGSGNRTGGTAGAAGGVAGISYNASNISMTNTGTITGRTS
jgi:hypothetical protein